MKLKATTWPPLLFQKCNKIEHTPLAKFIEEAAHHHLLVSAQSKFHNRHQRQSERHCQLTPTCFAQCVSRVIEQIYLWYFVRYAANTSKGHSERDKSRTPSSFLLSTPCNRWDLIPSMITKFWQVPSTIEIDFLSRFIWSPNTWPFAAEFEHYTARHSQPPKKIRWRLPIRLLWQLLLADYLKRCQCRHGALARPFCRACNMSTTRTIKLETKIGDDKSRLIWIYDPVIAGWGNVFMLW